DNIAGALLLSPGRTNTLRGRACRTCSTDRVAGAAPSNTPSTGTDRDGPPPAAVRAYLRWSTLTAPGSTNGQGELRGTRRPRNFAECATAIFSRDRLAPPAGSPRQENSCLWSDAARRSHIPRQRDIQRGTRFLSSWSRCE